MTEEKREEIIPILTPTMLAQFESKAKSWIASGEVLQDDVLLNLFTILQVLEWDAKNSVESKDRVRAAKAYAEFAYPLAQAALRRLALQGMPKAKVIPLLKEKS